VEEATLIYDFDRPIDRRHSDSEKWTHFEEDVLPLWVADMDFLSPEPVLRALRERVDHGIFGYGNDASELREVVVARMETLYGWRIAADAVVFIAGVVPGFNLACRAAAAPGDGVLLQTPVYPPFLRAPANACCRGDEMELTRQANGRYDVDLELMERTIAERTRVFILCNPHNPVGRVFTRSELQNMAEVCLRHNLVICSDEIHCDLILQGHHHIPIASLSPEVEKRTITLIAPSKTYNVPGLHCSVAIVPDKELRDRFRAAFAGLVGGVNVLGLVAALAAYRDGQEWLEQVLRYLERNCDFLLQSIARRMPAIHAAKPEGTYLAWLDCRGLGLEISPREFFLKQARVGLGDGAPFGRGGEGFVRLNFACRRATLEQALERMEIALRSSGPIGVS
jgi:cystathionine beta-lyase